MVTECVTDVAIDAFHNRCIADDLQTTRSCAILPKYIFIFLSFSVSILFITYTCRAFIEVIQDEEYDAPWKTKATKKAKAAFSDFKAFKSFKNPLIPDDDTEALSLNDN